MNKNLLLGLGGVAVVAAGAYFYMNQNGTAPSLMMGGEKTEAKMMSGSLADLMKLGKNYTCTFAETDPEFGTSQGTVYVLAEGAKFRADVNTTDEDGVAMMGHVMSDGEYNYIWSDDEEQGIKTKVSGEEDFDLFGQKDDSADAMDKDDTMMADDDMETEDPDNVDFDCKPWVPSPGMFVAPSDVEFVDFAAQMEAMMGGAEALGESTEGMEIPAEAMEYMGQ